MWDATQGKLHAELKHHRGTVQWVEFDASSNLVVSTGADGVVTISDVATGVPLSGGRLVRTSAHPAAVNAAAFARTGTDLVSASIDGSVWITRGERESFSLPTLPGGTDAVGFLPDGRVVAAGSGGGLRVYDPDRRLVLVELVTRSFTGELSPWGLAKPPSPQDAMRDLDRSLRCLPLRFDENTGGLVEQQTACDVPAKSARW